MRLTAASSAQGHLIRGIAPGVVLVSGGVGLKRRQVRPVQWQSHMILQASNLVFLLFSLWHHFTSSERPNRNTVTHIFVIVRNWGTSLHASIGWMCSAQDLHVRVSFFVVLHLTQCLKPCSFGVKLLGVGGKG